MATATAPASAGLLRAAVPNPNSIRSAHPHLHSLPSSSPSFPSSTSFRPIIKHLACTDRSIRITCSVGYREPYTPPAGAYPRPSEIQWKKELCNSVQLIGVVASPVQINQLNSGKVVASSRLGVWKSATDTTWINVTFWDDLAHTAFQHLEKGQRVYVSGRLVSDTVESDGGKQQTFYKVVVQQLNFIEKSFPSPVDLYDSDSGSTASGRIINNSSGNNKASVEQLWQAFFANPTDWWDNRKMKVFCNCIEC
ncbi:hypothetical protein Dimus_037705 [Dionaea muscipula]